MPRNRRTVFYVLTGEPATGSGRSSRSFPPRATRWATHQTSPTATFELTKPLALSKKNVNATGNPTLHGVTKLVTIPMQVAHSDSSVEAVGSLTFPWGEFDMTAPSVAGFVSVESKATMEFDLKLKRS
jgi:polyisoprenoid-binding protein YceI